MPGRSERLITFLQRLHALSHKTVLRYTDEETVIYLDGLPAGSPLIASPYFRPPADDAPRTSWLSLHTRQTLPLPPPPESLASWIDPADLARIDTEPMLRQTAEVFATCSEPDGPLPTTASLADHPQLEADWENYLHRHWRPWAEQARAWAAVSDLYTRLDHVRREASAAADRFELIFAFGLLRWQQPDGSQIERHLVTGPAEITLDVDRGILAVGPPVDFECFRLETDLVPPERHAAIDIDELLAEVDLDGWNRQLVEPALTRLANQWDAGRVGVDAAGRPVGPLPVHPQISFAPAIVLRSRRTSGYQTTLARLASLTRSHDDTAGPLAAAWERLLGPPAEPGSLSPQEPAEAEPGEPPELLFPLPVNAEQQTIAKALGETPCVLVKGPPGTGKSHTIANLICHLLATGDRVLITAQAAKALDVLREKLPKPLQRLCVTLMGSSRSDRRMLEESVGGILEQIDRWNSDEAATKIRHHRKQRAAIIASLAKIDRALLELRERELITHRLDPPYEGTAAAIAQSLAGDAPRFSWFPWKNLQGEQCPLSEARLARLAEAVATLSPQAVAEVAGELGPPLPAADRFAAVAAAITRIEVALPTADSRMQVIRRAASQDADLPKRLHAAIKAIEAAATRGKRSLGDEAANVIGDLLAGRGEVWQTRLDMLQSRLEEAATLLPLVARHVASVPAGIPPAALDHALAGRIAHHEAGGGRGFWPFRPRAVRETSHLDKLCRLDGRPPRSLDDFRALHAHVRLGLLSEALAASWPAVAEAARGDDAVPAAAVARWREFRDELAAIMKACAAIDPPAVAAVPPAARGELADREGRRRWAEAAVHATAANRAAGYRRKCDDLYRALCESAGRSDAHPLLARLAEAVASRDATAYALHAEPLEGLRRRAKTVAFLEDCLGRLEAAAPGLAATIRGHLGDAAFASRLAELPRAWAWARAKVWVGRFAHHEDHDALASRRTRLSRELAGHTEDLVALEAWGRFFTRLGDSTRRHLIAWQQAMTRLGRGTGKYANQHRREARRHLMACIPAIPVWIMPLHDLWNTVEAEADLFDTIIIDEASQAGLDALPLLLLGKRVVVIGDDKQNSPQAVGVDRAVVRQQIEGLLGDFPFRDSFQPESSLFDHARLAFDSQVTLREHFRCVPEIIRFSNTHFYEQKLVPLRQPDPGSLPPLVTVFVPEAHCSGSGTRIRNEAEAEAIVETICRLVRDEAYEGKSMGVIALQGKGQADFVERRLAERLTPREIEQRRLVCGEPAGFQGDERDVIFLSLVVADNHNFMAQTRAEAERRYNVAMSRAKDQAWLFHSVPASRLSQHDLRAKLLTHFTARPPAAGGSFEPEWFEAQAGRRRELGSQPEPFDSWFEFDVCRQLCLRGYLLHAQHEVAGRRIDLVIEGADKRLAVECDGDFWHAAEHMADDMHRQRQLERVGWTFVRVRESDYYVDPDAAIARIAAACEAMGIVPAGRGATGW